MKRPLAGLAVAVLGALHAASCASPAPPDPAAGAPAVSPSPTPPPEAVAEEVRVEFRKIAAGPDSETFTVDRKGAAWMAEHLDDVLRAVRFADHPGGGLHIVSFVPGSVADCLGLLPGDVLRSLNGIPIRNAGSIAALRGEESLREAKALVFSVERGRMVRALVLRAAR